uniref:CRISPR type III-B/RAMP module-associated protein Cmr5 n=1 Tax=Desulfomonile tiedjei TaxID=2358 RepID=A0A7C4ET41_9BACT
MDALTFENLDLACAKVGKTIAERPSKELENLLTNALAVLEEQGIYALFLFLKARGGSGAENVNQRLYEFLKETPRQAPLLSGNADVFPSLQQMANDLDKLLLARDLLRQILVYARYHARVPQKSEVQT